MKILIAPHDLALGGSQINAIDLAAEMSDAGHEVIVYGIDGPLSRYIRDKQLRFVAASPMQARPAPPRILELARLCRRERIEVIHAYEWPPCLDAYYGAHLLCGVPLVCTVLSMSVSPLVPDTVPLLMGTRLLADEAQLARPSTAPPVQVFEPPIDVAADHPDTDGWVFRRSLGVEDDELTIVSVSRLSYDLKFDALVDAIAALPLLSDKHRVRLILVGGGDAEHEIQRRAAEVNEQLGRPAVLTPGPTLDPRAAYASADVVVAMGSSALRAMAHRKAVVVQGERGWSLPCNPDTIDTFFHQGFFGVGAGGTGEALLAQHLDVLLGDADGRAAIGKWGRDVVVDRFSLAAGAQRLTAMYSALVHEGRATGRRDNAKALLQTTRRAFTNEIAYHVPSTLLNRWHPPLGSHQQHRPPG